MFGFDFEGFFNGDLIMYIDEYNIQLVKFVIRGIVRYRVKIFFVEEFIGLKLLIDFYKVIDCL